MSEMREMDLGTGFIHPQVVNGRSLWMDSGLTTLIDKLQNGDPTLGWEGDPRLALFMDDNDRWVLSRLEADGEYRDICKSRPGLPRDGRRIMRLMEDGKPFKPHMEKLEGSARYFFETEFFHPSFAATKKQILKRLWGVLSTPAFERMFAQEANKLDLFEAMNEGKIILISTAKDLLKSDGSALLGRFFIAMLAQAALERSTIPAEDRTPTFVYVDEAQEYFENTGFSLWTF